MVALSRKCVARTSYVIFRSLDLPSNGTGAVPLCRIFYLCFIFAIILTWTGWKLCRRWREYSFMPVTVHSTEVRKGRQACISANFQQNFVELNNTVVYTIATTNLKKKSNHRNICHYSTTHDSSIPRKTNSFCSTWMVAMLMWIWCTLNSCCHFDFTCALACLVDLFFLACFEECSLKVP